ncbi:MAG: polysaccharide deacetylase family protein [Clostridium sp.]
MKKLKSDAMRKTGIPGTVMLTFDDGPDIRYTGRLLDLLKEQNVQAVFFVVTREAKGNEALIKRMQAEGHRVGFHSTDHQNAMLRGWQHTRTDFRDGVQFFRELGIMPVYYRPPWGLSNLFTGYYMRQYNLKMVLWDVMAEDWKAGATVDLIREKCLSRVKDQSIICLHDGGERSGGAKGAPEKVLQALPSVIRELKMAGYRFVLPGENK